MLESDFGLSRIDLRKKEAALIIFLATIGPQLSPLSADNKGRRKLSGYKNVAFRIGKHIAHSTRITAKALASASIKLVKAADKIDNIRSTCSGLLEFGMDFWTKYRGSACSFLWYHGEILRILEETFPHPITRDLRSAFDHLKTLQAA